MAAAALTAFAKSSFHIGAIAPMVATPDAHMAAAGIAALASVALAIPLVLNARRLRSAAAASSSSSSSSPMANATIHNGLAGLWAGSVFGTGLAIGGKSLI